MQRADGYRRYLKEIGNYDPTLELSRSPARVQYFRFTVGRPSADRGSRGSDDWNGIIRAGWTRWGRYDWGGVRSASLFGRRKSHCDSVNKSD